MSSVLRTAMTISKSYMSRFRFRSRETSTLRGCYTRLESVHDSAMTDLVLIISVGLFVWFFEYNVRDNDNR